MKAINNSIANSSKKINAFLVICIVLMLIVFAVDLQLPLGVAGGVLYVIVVLASLWLNNYKYVISLATICTFLTLLGLYLSPPGGELWKVIGNRGLAIFAIWATAILARKWEATIKMNANLLSEKKKQLEIKKIYVATMRSSLHVTNNLLNQLKFIEMQIENNPNVDRQVIMLFREIQEEAKSLMSKLSSVETIEEEAIIRSVYPK